MIDQSQVTAVIVTRGNVDLAPIFDTLLDYDDAIVWDNSIRPDWKVAGRYIACLGVHTDHVFFQDDDTIVPPETQRELLANWAGGDCLANWGHGENPDGYDDLPLVCGGAIVDWRASWDCIARFAAHHPLDVGFQYEADFVVGVLYRDWQHLHLPFQIRDVAYNGDRLADELWQRAEKKRYTDLARTIRDREMVAA